MAILLTAWATLQALSVWGVANYLRHLPRERLTAAPAGVVVIACVRTPWPGAKRFVSALLAQDTVEARLMLVLSGPPDAALSAIAATHPERVQLVAAGVATDEGQKIHKLRAALDALHPDDDYLVLLDTDIAPPARLLGRLLFPLAAGKTAIGTGYRLLLPEAGHRVASLIAAIDLQVATLPRPPRKTLPWGGALALTRAQAETLALGAAWGGRLSDDLTIARVARFVGIGIRPVRDLLVASPFRATAREAFAFGVRQYRHLFWNLRGTWIAAASIVGAASVGWVWALGWGGWPALALGYAAAWTRVALRMAIASRVLGPGERPAVRRSLCWDALLPFIVVWTHFCLVIIGSLSRRIRWAGFEYRMQTGGAVSSVTKLG